VIYRNGAENADALPRQAWLANLSGAGKKDDLLGVRGEGGERERGGA